MESRKIIVPFVSDIFPELMDLEEFGSFSSYFEQIGRPLQIDNRPWPEYPDRPEVSVRVAATGEYLLMKFAVREKEVLGRYSEDGIDVERDSCVHLYLSGRDDHGGFYHFAFNCLGSCFAEHVESSGEKSEIPSAYLSRIFRESSLGRKCCVHLEQEAGESPTWTLMVAIPAECFWKDEIDSFQGGRFRGNFCKTGEDLHKPHYLSWSMPNASDADFYDLKSFGEIWIS